MAKRDDDLIVFCKYTPRAILLAIRDRKDLEYWNYNKKLFRKLIAC